MSASNAGTDIDGCTGLGRGDPDKSRSKRGDNASDVFMRLNIPLFTPRVNLSLWMVPVERWHQSTENIIACRLVENNLKYKKVRSGAATGDVYVSADIHVIQARDYGWRPDWTIRAALKTASGNDHYLGRYYDAPGYFFDTSVAESFSLGKSSVWQHRLRVALSTGFLCWQSGTGRQNDAVMYGVMLKWDNKYFSVAETFGGYCGWEGQGDKPMTLKTQVLYHLGRFDILGACQFGFKDWNYRQLRPFLPAAAKPRDAFDVRHQPGTNAEDNRHENKDVVNLAINASAKG